jgi:hypothetical protein
VRDAAGNARAKAAVDIGKYLLLAALSAVGTFESFFS